MKAISAALLALLIGCSAQEPEVSRDTAPESVAETVSDHPAISHIAFGSCAFQWTEQPIFRAVVAVEPDLYLSLGDAIYGDFDVEGGVQREHEVGLWELPADSEVGSE